MHIRQRENTLYGGGDFPFLFTHKSVGQMFVMIVDEKDLGKSRNIDVN